MDAKSVVKNCVFCVGVKVRVRTVARWSVCVKSTVQTVCCVNCCSVNVIMIVEYKCVNCECMYALVRSGFVNACWCHNVVGECRCEGVL